MKHEIFKEGKGDGRLEIALHGAYLALEVSDTTALVDSG